MSKIDSIDFKFFQRVRKKLSYSVVFCIRLFQSNCAMFVLLLFFFCDKRILICKFVRSIKSNRKAHYFQKKKIGKSLRSQNVCFFERLTLKIPKFYLYFWAFLF